MTTTELPSPEDYGFVSNDFLLKHGLAHIPHASLYRATAALITYLVEADEVDRLEALDILTQVAFTGGYVKIIGLDREATITAYVETAEDAITDDEIDQFVEDIGDAFPTAVDPFEGWQMNAEES